MYLKIEEKEGELLPVYLLEELWKAELSSPVSSGEVLALVVPLGTNSAPREGAVERELCAIVCCQ